MLAQPSDVANVGSPYNRCKFFLHLSRVRPLTTSAADAESEMRKRDLRYYEMRGVEAQIGFSRPRKRCLAHFDAVRERLLVGQVHRGLLRELLGVEGLALAVEVDTVATDFDA